MDRKVVESLKLCFLEWLQWSPHPQLLDVVWCSAVVVVGVGVAVVVAVVGVVVATCSCNVV